MPVRKMHSFSVKTHQKSFVGGVPPEPAEGTYNDYTIAGFMGIIGEKMREKGRRDRPTVISKSRRLCSDTHEDDAVSLSICTGLNIDSLRGRTVHRNNGHDGGNIRQMSSGGARLSATTLRHSFHPHGSYHRMSEGHFHRRHVL